MATAREAWGCDAPSKHVVFEVTCSACAGASDECPKCEGTGLVSFNRCPSAVVRECSPGERGNIEAAVRAYIQYDSRGTLPYAGGYMEQSGAFGTIVDIIDSERGRFEGILNERRERERKKSDAESRRKGSAVHRPFNSKPKR